MTTAPDEADTPHQFVFPSTWGPPRGPTVANSTVDAASFVLNEGTTLAVSDLQMRLYYTSGNNDLPVLGDAPAGLLAGWSNAISTNGSTSNLGTTMLTAGTYVLEVRGDVTGTGGGSYAGLNPAARRSLPRGGWERTQTPVSVCETLPACIAHVLL
jgi:hypothetical protein